MSTTIESWIVGFLINSVWMGAVVALLACATNRLLRRASVRYRHLLWVAALTAVIALSFSALLRIPISPAPAQSRTLLTNQMPHEMEPALVKPLPTAAERHPSRFAVPALAIGQSAALAVAWIYGLLIFTRVITFALSWWRTHRFINQAQVVDVPLFAAAALARCQRLLRLQDITILTSATLRGPVTAGAFRPVVIVPLELLTEANLDLVTTAIGHELAHVARRDYLFNLLYELIAMPLWFHPTLALALRRIRETRELRCDEIVTERLQDARVYARSLLQLAGAALPFGRAAVTITVGIADANILEERVKTLLNRPAVKKQSIMIVGAALLFAVPCLAAASVALRVNVSSSSPASTTPQQTNAIQDFISQHQVGDMVRGKVLKTGAARAVIELAPGVTSVMRIPAYISEPISVGSERDFTIVRLNSDEQNIVLVDPSAPPQKPENYNIITAGGPAEGISGGVSNGVGVGIGGGVSGVNGGIEGGVMIKPALAGAEPQENSGAQQSSKEAAARAKAVQEQIESLEHEGSALTPEQAERVEALKKVAAKLAVADESSLTPEERAERLAFMRDKIVAEQKERLELAREAKITMEQAIQIALGQQPGTVLDSPLTRERQQATYIISVLSGEQDNPTTTRFLISAIDGKIIDSFTQRDKTQQTGAAPSACGVNCVRLNQSDLQASQIKSVAPVYPPVARAAKVQGSVVILARIGRNGEVAALQVLSGHPMLVQAAMEAVRQWQFQPYVVNGEPAEVEAQLTVNFVLPTT